MRGHTHLSQATPIIFFALFFLDCSITALLYSNMELAVGLNCGLILVLHPFSFTLLCSLSCHRDNISSLLSLDLSQQLQLSSAAYNTSSCPPSSSLFTTRATLTLKIAHTHTLGTSAAHFIYSLESHVIE